MPLVKKRGFMLRACVAWTVLNAILVFTLAVLVYVIRPYLNSWYVMIPVIVAFVVSEWVIMSETIAPIVKDWVKQEEKSMSKTDRGGNDGNEK